MDNQMYCRQCQETANNKACTIAGVCGKNANLANDLLKEKSKSKEISMLSIQDEDIRSLKELITFGLKGLSAYLKHANALGYESEEINIFIQETLMKLMDDSLTLNDLRDLEQLLIQTEGTGIDVYTHSEMLPAHYYPELKKYPHLVGNYGNAWWKQREEFESFNGPILMTTNCIVPPKDSYKSRMFTTGSAGYSGSTQIEVNSKNEKDFSEIIELAKKCKAPDEIENGSIIGGFAHEQLSALADTIVEAIKSGAIKKFVVMAGCDGRSASRSYYSDFAKALYYL